MQDLLLRFRGDSTGAKKAFQEVGGSTKSLKSQVLGLAGPMAAAFSVAAVVKFAKESVAAAMKAEVSWARMGAAVTAAGDSFATVQPRVKELVGELSDLSALGKGDLRDAFTTLVQMTGDSEQAMRLMGVATDVARAKNWTAAQSAQKLGLVLAGNTRVLKQFGIEAKEGGNRLEYIRMIQDRARGAAKAYGDTTQGATEKMQNSIRALKTAIGTELLPIVKEGSILVTAFTKGFTKGLSDGLVQVGSASERAAYGLAQLNDTFTKLGEGAGKFIANAQLWRIGLTLMSGQIALAIPQIRAWYKGLQDASKGGKTAKDAALEFAKAQAALGGATDDTTDAILSQADANDILRDSGLDVVDAQIADERAKFRLIDAEKALKEVRKNPKATAREIREAELDVIDARNGTIRSAARMTEAMEANASAVTESTVSMAAEVSETLARTFKPEDYRRMGDAVPAGLTRGIKQGTPDAATAAQGLAASVTSPFAPIPGTMYGVGAGIVQGLTSGLLSPDERAKLQAAATSLGNAVPAWVRVLLEISSPSKVMEGIGEDTVAGFADGLMKDGSKVRISTAVLETWGGFGSDVALVAEGVSDLFDARDVTRQQRSYEAALRNVAKVRDKYAKDKDMPRGSSLRYTTSEDVGKAEAVAAKRRKAITADEEHAARLKVAADKVKKARKAYAEADSDVRAHEKDKDNPVDKMRKFYENAVARRERVAKDLDKAQSEFEAVRHRGVTEDDRYAERRRLAAAKLAEVEKEYGEAVSKHATAKRTKEAPSWIEELGASATRLKGELDKARKEYEALAFETGEGIGAALGEGVKSGAGAAKAPVQRLGRDLPTWLRADVSSIRSVGSSVGAGLAEGIRGSTPTVKSAVTGMARNVPRWMREELRAKSPSQEMADVGADAVAGFMLGLERERIRPLDLSALLGAEIPETIPLQVVASVLMPEIPPLDVAARLTLDTGVLDRIAGESPAPVATTTNNYTVNVTAQDATSVPVIRKAVEDVLRTEVRSALALGRAS